MSSQAYTAYNDHDIGRVIQAFEDMGKLGNTLVLYINGGHNGTSSEGTMMGTPNWMAAANGVLELPELEYLRLLRILGFRPNLSPHGGSMGLGLRTPLNGSSMVASLFGGTRQGMAISWPGHIDDVRLASGRSSTLLRYRAAHPRSRRHPGASGSRRH